VNWNTRSSLLAHVEVEADAVLAAVEISLMEFENCLFSVLALFTDVPLFCTLVFNLSKASFVALIFVASAPLYSVCMLFNF